MAANPQPEAEINQDKAPEKSAGFNISEMAIRRPVSTVMLIVCMLVLGLMSYINLPVELFPDVSFPIVSISTTYPGASAREMETLVAKPLEDAVSALNGIEHITSTSSNGIATVIIQFKLEKSIKEAANEAIVRYRDEVRQGRFPDEGHSFS